MADSPPVPLSRIALLCGISRFPGFRSQAGFSKSGTEKRIQSTALLSGGQARRGETLLGMTDLFSDGTRTLIMKGKMTKSFDAVAFMRRRRDELSAQYNSDPAKFRRELSNISKKYTQSRRQKTASAKSKTSQVH